MKKLSPRARSKTAIKAVPAATPTPATPTIPLSPEMKAAYQDLYNKIQNALDNTMDAAVVEALNPALAQVDQVLTQNDEYTLTKDTAIFATLQKQIKDTNDGLATLEGQLKAIAGHFALAGDILSAIDKVLNLV